MKKLIILLGFFVMGFSVHAQTKMTEKEDTKLSPTKTDGYMMKDGKMMLMKNGITEPIEEDIKQKNGIVIMKNGMVKYKDGKTIQLKEGEWVLTDGTIKPAVPKKAG